MDGMIAVKGMALAAAHVVRELSVDTKKRPVEDGDAEAARLEQAKNKCAEELSSLMERLGEETDDQSAEILDFQLLLLEDANYFGQIVQRVRTEKVNCEHAVADRSESYRKELMALDNPYLNERTADIADLEERLLGILSGKKEGEVADGPQIVVARDLTPSQVAEFGPLRLKGIVLEKGGMSSHCVILARSMGIPCLIHVTDALSRVKEGEQILLDCERGTLKISPTEKDLQDYDRYKENIQREAKELEQFRTKETVTADGRPMKVYANVSAEAEIGELLMQGGEGVGLLRTEMIYMESSVPPEEEKQYEIYSRMARALQGRPLIVRTLDVGGDKHISYLDIPEEENPFLGYRAIRYCLEHEELFRAQLSAVLRAGACGKVQLMIPMVSTLSEIERVKELIDRVKEELRLEGRECGPVDIGMMVETPAAALMADHFAKAVDFFSIGTNDLTQYLFAADRNNARVAELNSYYQPALLRTMNYICECARKNGIEVDICGQAGEAEDLIPLWIGMGVDNLSVSVPSITRVRRKICRCSAKKCEELLRQVLLLQSEKEVRDHIRKEAAGW